MKRSFLFFILLMPACVMAQSTAQSLKDSLRQVIATVEGAEKLTAYGRLTNIYFVESARDDLKMDTLLALYREYDAEALRQERFDLQGVVRTNIIGAHTNRSEYGEVVRLTPEFLAYLSKQEVWTHYYSVYRSYIHALINMNEYSKAIERAQQMYDEANQRDHDGGRGFALYALSTVYGNMSRNEEEAKYMREAVDFLKKDVGLVSFTAQAYFRLCNALINLGRYDEALIEAKEFEKINYLYEEESKSHQPTTWMNLWRIYMNLYVNTERYDMAEIYCNRLDSIGGGMSVQHTIANARARIYHSRRQYASALDMTDKALALTGGNLNQINATQLLRLMILCSMRGIDDIHELFKEASNLRDSIRNTEFNERLDHVRMQYEVDRIEAEKERAVIEKVRNRNYFLFAAGGCVLLVITLGIWVYYSRTVMRKNQGLYLRLKEQDGLAEELEKIKTQYQPAKEDLSDDENSGQQGNAQQRRLVARLKDYMLRDNNYAKTEIERDKVVYQLTTNKTYLFESVKAVTGKSLQEYINELRIVEAKRLLQAQPDLSIQSIVDSCGFTSRSTFYRLFDEHYQISPSEYRKFARKNR
jgi:AraC-like DNA-binding protein